MATVIGFRAVTGTSKQTGKPYSGYQVYTTYDSDKVEGQGAERSYISSAADYRPAVGDEIEFLYNRYGNVSGVRYLDENA